MKRRGFTLVEFIITLSILSVIMGITFVGISNYFKINEKLNFESTISEVKRLLSYGKSYCRRYKVIGNIAIDKHGKSIKFLVSDINNGIKKEIKMDENFNIPNKAGSSNLEISEEGFIKNSVTITINYKDKYKKEIKIGVGNDIIGISEGDLIDWKEGIKEEVC